MKYRNVHGHVDGCDLQRGKRKRSYDEKIITRYGEERMLTGFNLVKCYDDPCLYRVFRCEG